MKKALSILFAGCVISSAFSKITIDWKTRTFKDEYYRARIFHGTNVVVKGAPYLPVTDRFDAQMSLSDQDLQDMIDWGIHAVRLGVMWESVETTELSYNHTYLDEVDKLITRLGEKGIYTLVDAHQDLFSRQTCGEGMPHFYATDLDSTCSSSIPGILFNLFGQCKAINDYNFRKDELGRPLIEDCLQNSFIKYYTSPEVVSSFEKLYTNETVQERFLAFWDVVSKRLANNSYIMGYDPINEPWPANFYKDFSLFLVQTKFDTTFLYPLLQKAHDTIRKNVPNMNYFFEPAQFPDTFPVLGGQVAHLAFPDLPGGQEYRSYQALNDHTYCCQASASMCASGEPPLDQKETCSTFHERKVSTRAADAQKYKVPLIFTEFGACANTLECFNEITSAADQFDNYMASWMYWMFKGFGDFTTTGSLTEGMYDKDGNLQIYKQLALLRTFIHAWQGVPLAMKFINSGEQNGTFTAQFTVFTNIDAPTEIYFNQELYYPNGYQVSVVAAGTPLPDIEIDRTQKNYLKFKITDSKYNGQNVTVVLTPPFHNSTFASSFTQNEYVMKYNIQQSGGENSGKVTFRINGQNLFSSEKISFELQDKDHNMICQGNSAYQECEESNYLATSAHIILKKKGWFLTDKELEFDFYNLNGHVVDITFEKTKAEF